MADGHLNKCKECTKTDAKSNYRRNIEKIRSYDKKREKDPERRKRKIQYQANSRINSSEKYRARTAVQNGLRDGIIQKKPCEICGEPKSEAHHEDYSKPLEVKWLCFVHHREAHGQKPHRKNPNRESPYGEISPF
jgi:hypothetical protein